jgi:pimeloyl-ACP methyl ester carboxylesterase
VLAPDLAGFGLTPRAGRGSDLRSNRLLLSSFLEATGTRECILVGSSMGGALSLLQTAVEPDSVRGLILTGAALPWARGVRPSPATDVGFTLYRIPLVGEIFAQWRIRGMTPERTVELGFSLVAAHPERLDEATIRSQVEMVRLQQSDPDAVAAFLQAARSLMRLGSFRRATREILDRATCPVLVLHGDRDALVPLAFAEAAADERPSWRLRVFENAGHALQLEVPDRWIAETDAWLDDVGFGARKRAPSGRARARESA